MILWHRFHSIGRRGDTTGGAEQRAEGVERVEAAVEAEGEFIEIGLEVLRTDILAARNQTEGGVCVSTVESIRLSFMRSTKKQVGTFLYPRENNLCWPRVHKKRAHQAMNSVVIHGYGLSFQSHPCRPHGSR